MNHKLTNKRDGHLSLSVHCYAHKIEHFLKTLQLAKISKVLMALEQGRLAEFHGKNLDEIEIDPDGVLCYLTFLFCLASILFCLI